MPTFLFDACVFGPIKSRRLGSSLGINLLSLNQKVCNFDCIYCECGSSHHLKKELPTFVENDDLLTDLENRLKECTSNNTLIDTITFAGNGEPTIHPKFLSIVKAVISLRDKYFPSAQVAVLTNGVAMKNKRVSAALKLVDMAIIKLDGGTDDFINLIDQPKRKLSIVKFQNEMAKFDGEFIIQTMFLKGSVNGKLVDNSSGEELEQWLMRIKEINPKEVHLYSIDRDTPIDTLECIPKERLEMIASRVNELGIETLVV